MLFSFDFICFMTQPSNFADFSMNTQILRLYYIGIYVSRLYYIALIMGKTNSINLSEKG
jgi:hypothetical protein